MSTANPTSLKIGASGILDGHRCTVTGRVVLGVEVEGETYYWNEYQLADDAGFTAILVYEEEETGPAWKLFIPLELQRGFSALEAAKFREGDTVAFDDTRGQVSLTGQSRVYHVEGEAPEGVEVGDVASYFNAEAGNRTLVASWTGSEIEYYRGRTLPAEVVQAAFNLPKAELSLAALSRLSGASGPKVSGGTLKMVLAGLMLVTGFAGRACSTDNTNVTPPPATLAAGSSPLVLGAHGALAGREVTVTAHALVGVLAPPGNFERHEFVLSAGQTNLLLLQRLERNAAGWLLLSQARIPTGLNAYALAALPVGAKLDVAGTAFTVDSLFSGTSAQTEGVMAGLGAPKESYFGLSGHAASGERLLARWTETRLEIHVGPVIGEKEVLAALGAKEKR